MPETIRPLTSDDFDTVHAAFLEAFSDYVVPFQPSREQLRETLTRRGYVPELSTGAFDGERIVGFTLNGVSEGRAYDSGTGVVPSHRRRGLASRMLDFVSDRLRNAGYTHYVLEVVESNEPAVELYLIHGFHETRRLQCWSYEPARHGEAAAIDEPDWIELRSWWDVEPSWQNAIPSLHRARDRYVAVGDQDSYAVVFPATGDLPQLAVRGNERRNGRGRALLDAAATLAGKPLRIMNVDARNAGIDAFLSRCGAKKTVRQIEMERSL